MKYLSDFNFENKRVLVRADFNQPIKDGKLANDFKIRATLPTIEYLLDKKAKIVLMTHLGRPNGKIVQKLKTDPIGERISQLIKRPVKKIDYCQGEEIEKEVNQMESGQIILLENVQFCLGEKENDPEYVNNLAKLADFFVLDAFAQSHRNYASIAGLPKIMPSCAGLLLEKEIKALSKVLENPEHPLVIIIGGAKISTKMKVIKGLLEKVDHILLGGALANTALKANGVDVGKSIIEDKMIGKAKEILGNPKIHLPIDWVISDEMILDIGPKTIEEFNEIISSAKMIIWNGPMGLFEKDKFRSGSDKIAQAVAQSEGFSLVGGGDTITLLEGLNLLDKINHVSTGGGAMLDFISGKKLPGIEALG